LRAKKRRKEPGRPKGTTIPLERDPQRFEIAVWQGIHLDGHGPYTSAHWAAWVTSRKPIKLEDVEGLLTVAGTEIEFTASNLDKHIDRLARKAESIPVDSDPWLHASALAIKAFILARRTRNMEMECYLLDVLLSLGWRDVIERLIARINDMLKSNIPPREGELGREGQALVNWLRSVTIGEKLK
jgi:hypothetical protein